MYRERVSSAPCFFLSFLHPVLSFLNDRVARQTLCSLRSSFEPAFFPSLSSPRQEAEARSGDILRPVSAIINEWRGNRVVGHANVRRSIRGKVTLPSRRLAWISLPCQQCARSSLVYPSMNVYRHTVQFRNVVREPHGRLVKSPRDQDRVTSVKCPWSDY